MPGFGGSPSRRLPVRPAMVLAVLLALFGPASGGAPWAAGVDARPAAILEVGTSVQCAYHTLAAAVAAAQSGDTIKMEDTTFVMEPLTIDGQDLTLAGGYAGGGIVDCLTGNRYGATTLIVSPGWTAKAIRVMNAAVSLSRFTFEGNDDGGGGLSVWDGALNLDYVNVGHTNGGLILSSSPATLVHCWFYDNSSDVDGGGIYAFGPATLLTLTDVELRRNHSVGRGGAIMLSVGAQMQADDCVIAGGEANEGGGLYVKEGATAIVRSSVIEDNHGWLRGAGASVRFGGSLYATEGTEFVNNITPAGCEEGGGIYASDAGSEVILDASLVMTNSALARGGGLYVGNGAAATLDNGTVLGDNEVLDLTVGNGAGAYVAGEGAGLVVLEATIKTNWAANDGGGIYNSGGTISLDGAGIHGNHAAHSGGGLFNDGGTVTGQRLSIGTNVAHGGEGGALYSQEGTVDVQQSTIYFNTALAGGGAAIATFNTDVALGRSYVHHNSAAGDGSVLLVSGSEQDELSLARITNNMLVDNETLGAATGSDVYVEWAIAHLWHNTHHRHEPDGSAIYAGDGSVVSLIDSIIANFAVGIRRPAAGPGQAQATYTLYHDNALDYDPDVLSTNDVHGDPLFASPGNYHLAAGSPAIDAGMDAMVTGDYDGQPRPMGRGFDIGADEFVPTVFVPLVVKNW